MTSDATFHKDSISILHVDDDEQIRMLFEESLEFADGSFTVHSAADPRRALELLDDDIECIVSDYRMPGMNGLEFLQAVRLERPDLPFILLTGKGSEELASEAISAGLTDYFQKTDLPEQFSVLAHRIETVVEGERAEVSYRALFETAADGLALNDPETGAFVDANPAFRELFGLTQSEVLSMGVADIQRLSPENMQTRSLLEHLRHAAVSGTTPVEECCSRATGERFWLALQFTPIEVKGRSLVLTQARDITERKRYEQTLSALHTAVTEIVAAERPRQVTGSVLSAIDDLLAADRAAVFRHTAPANRLEVVDATSDPGAAGAVPLDSDHPLARAFVTGRSFEGADASVFGDHAGDDPAGGWTLVVPIGSGGVLAVEYDERASYAADDSEFTAILANATAAAFERIEKDERIDSSEEALRRRTAELQRLEHGNATLSALNNSLLRAETATEIFETVCEQLSDIAGVSLAWIGTPTEENVLEPRAWAGDVPQYLDTVSLELDSSQEPGVVAARSGSPVSIENTAVDIHRQPWKRAALSHGIEAIVAVPIEVDGLTEGVLSVLSEDQTTFDGRFEGLVSAVASSVGETIHAVEQRQGLQAGTPVEVTFEIDVDSHLLGRLAAAAECELDVTGVLVEPDGTCRLFVGVDGAEPSSVANVARTMSAVRSATVVNDDAAGSVELHLEIPLLGAGLREYAVRITELSAAPDAVQAALEVAQPEDVRAVATAIQEQYPGTRLLAKRTLGDDPSDTERLRAFRGSLTPRQREVVQVAYLNGYFESPRQCTGEELGEKLGISSQAVYQHIRGAERQLFEKAFSQLRAVESTGE